jgi:hypothetical protein
MVFVTRKKTKLDELIDAFLKKVQHGDNEKESVDCNTPPLKHASFAK